MSVSSSALRSGSAAPRKSEGETSFHLGILAFAVASTIIVAVLLTRPGGDSGTMWFDDIAATLMTGAMGLWCVTDALRPRAGGASQRRWVSVYLGLSTILFSVGNAIKAYYELTLHRTPETLSLADVGHLAAYPILLIGLLRLPVRPLASSSRSQTVLDIVMTVTALFTVSWALLLAPVFADRAADTIGKIGGACYPFWDLLLVIGILVVFEHAQDIRMRNAILLAIAGMAGMVLADSISAYGAAHGILQRGTVADAGWPLGFGLVALAGLVARRDIGDDYAAAAHVHVGATGDTAQEPRELSMRSFLPYALAPLVLALTASTLAEHGGRIQSAGVYAGCLAFLGLVLIRQVGAVLEINGLKANLSEAYRNLQIVHEALEMKTKSLATATNRLEGLAATDGMTGLANHRKFQERLREEIEHSKTSIVPCSLLMIDLDHFKPYNDSYGHPAGDEVLKIVGRLAREAVRPTDLVARYGGEEFAVILPGADARIAMQVAERIRQRVERYEFAYRKVTVSLGVSGIAGGVDIDAEFWIEDTETALCRAKYGGRNTTVLSQVFEPEPRFKQKR